MRSIVVYLVALMLLQAQVLMGQMPNGWKAHDWNRPTPKVVVPADSVGNAPGDAVVLFDGTDLSSWRSADGSEAKWKLIDGAMVSVPKSGFVFSRKEFGDCQLHVEFATPTPPKGRGQGRGNSGVFLMGAFEVQILDSFESMTYADGIAGGIYGQFPPLVNASRKPGQWQTYDIIFRRPRFDENGKLTKPAVITVLHNGVLVQDGTQPFGPSDWILHKSYDSLKGKTKASLSLQDHGNPIRYRNIWARPLAESRPLPEKPYQQATTVIDDTMAAKLAGKYGRHEIKLENGKLNLLFQGKRRLELVPYSNTEFGFTKSAGSLTIQTDESGEVIGIELKLDATKSVTAQRSSPK